MTTGARRAGLPGPHPHVPPLVSRWLAECPERRHRTLDATLCFIDLSGFTALSERLAKIGREGAEEVADSIDQTFAQLLATAGSWGGQLLKFGGDALLLLFTGAENGPRGVAAAHAMRSQLRTAGRLETSAGIIQLRMSAAVHTGSIDLFLVGDSHRELVVTGPGVTAVADAESAAETGEIVVTLGAAATLDPSATGDARGPGRLLLTCPDVALPASDRAAVPTPTPTTVRASDVFSAVPVALREVADADAVDSEHRPVTIGFFHFGGIDALLEAGRADEVTDLIDSIVQTAQIECEREGVTFLGTDLYPDGSKIILVAGAPTALENDQERLLTVARALLDAHGTHVRGGVNHGHVFAGEIGSIERRVYTVMGDAVNLAARLMQRAAVGQLLTTNEVLERSATVFDAEVQDAFTPKGKTDAVEPWAVGERGARREAETAEVFVGREPLVDRLDGLAAATRDASGAVAIITGEPGVGKSALVSTVRRQADVDARFEVVCERHRATTPYFAFQVLVRSALGIALDATPAEAGEQLRTVVGDQAAPLLGWLPLVATVIDAEVSSTPQADDLADTFRGAKVAEVTLDVLAAVMSRATIVTFEDAHWMDEASRSILVELARRVRRRPWLVLVVQRGVAEAIDIDGAEQVAVGDLDPEESLHLVRALTGTDPLPPHEVDALVERSGGNPLFLTEFIGHRMLHGGDDLPDSVEQLIASRLDSLAPEERRILRTASVLGTFVDESLLSEALGAPPGQASLRRLRPYLARTGPGLLRFRQDLHRDVAYQALPFKRRRSIHGVIAGLLEGRANASAEALSFHSHAARQYVTSWVHSKIAAQRATHRWANIEAASFYARALDAARHLDDVEPAEVVDITVALGLAYELAGRHAEARACFVRARRLATDSTTVADLWFKQGHVDAQAGDLTQAVRGIRKALRTLDALETDPTGEEEQRLTVRCLVRLAQIDHARGRSRAAIGLGRRAAALAARAGDRPGEAHAHSLLHLVTFQLGMPESADHRDLPLAVYEEIGDLRQLGWMLNNIGYEASVASRWDDAQGFYARAKEIFDRSGNTLGMAAAANNVGEIQSNQGRLVDAAANLEDALAIWRPAGFVDGLIESTLQLGRVLARSGRNDEALAALADARVEATSSGRTPALLEIDVARVEALVLGHRAAEALELADEIGAEVERHHAGRGLAVHLAVCRGLALAHLERLDEALACIDAAEAAARDGGAFEWALALAARAEVAGGEQDVRRAQEIFATLGVVRSPLAGATAA